MQNTKYVAVLVAAAGLAAGASAQTDIFWNAGSGGWNNSLNWNPMNVPNLATENALIQGPGGINVTLDVTTTVLDLEVGSGVGLTLDPARSLSVHGNIANAGLITLNPTTSINNASITFQNPATLAGGGTLRLAGGGNDAALFTGVGATVTNVLGHNIDGAGQIGASLINDSVVTATDTGFGNVLEILGVAKTNNLVMQANSAAELQIIGTTIHQAPAGVIRANSGGLVRFVGSSTINGGSIDGPGTLLKPVSGNLTLNSVSIDDDLDVEASAGVIHSGATFDCAGTITLNDSSSLNNAFVQFNTDTTISGGGSIFLAGGGAPGGSNDSAVSTNLSTLTVAPGFTIEGSGDVNASLVNNGLLRAFPSTNGDGRLRLVSLAKTNNAQIVADTGGVIEINGIPITQSASGLILADGGTVHLNGSQTISNGTIRSISGGEFTRSGNGNTTLNDVVIDTDIAVAANSGILYSGTMFDCSGAIVLNDSSSPNNAFIQFNTSSTATGGGSIFLGGGGNDSQVITSVSTFTIAPDFTVEGSGDVAALLINNGLVRAFPSEFGDGRLRLFSLAKTNNADMVADTGGVLEFTGITVTQGSAGVILGDGGEIHLNGSQTINGGTLRTANGGIVSRSGNGNTTMSDVFIDCDISLAAPSGLIYGSDTLVCTGTVAINDSPSANNSFVQFNSDTTVSGGGRLFLGGGGNDSQVVTSASTFTIAPDFTVEGSGDVAASLVNNGLVRAFPSTNGNGRLRLFSLSKTNNSQMVADTGGVLEITGMTITQNSEGGVPGELLADGGIVEFNGSQTVNGGVMRTANGGRLVKKGNGNLVASDLTLEGDLELEAPSAFLYGGLTFVNNGVVRINSTDSSNNAFVQFNADTVVTGDGRFALEGGGDDSQLITSASTATFGPDQRVEGEGQMFGSYVLDGVLAPGLPIGTINGSASVDFGPSARYEVETSSVTTHDRLNVPGGTVNPDGLVIVQLREAYVPALNDQINIITAGTVSGLFDDVVVSVGLLPANLDVRLVYTPSTVDVKFVCLADLAPPFGVLDLADVTGFTSAFLAHDPLADLAEPIGVFDLADINAFVTNFLSGCN